MKKKSSKKKDTTSKTEKKVVKKVSSSKEKAQSNVKADPITNIIGGIATKIVWAFLKLCVFVYRFFKHVFYALIWPIILIGVFFKKRALSKGTVNVEKLKKKSQKILEKEKKKAAKKHIDTTEYKNESIKIKRKTLGDYINTVLTAIISVPKIIKKRINNSAVVKQARNKRDFDTNTMLVDYSTDDEKSTTGKKILWEYVAINEKGKKIKDYFWAFSKLDVQSFLIGQGLAVYSIRTSKMIQLLHGNVGGGYKRIKNKDLIFILAQLSTYLKSGITLVESLNILTRQVKKKTHKNIFRDLTYDLTIGENFSKALEKRGKAFPKLLVSMIKASELTGELPEALDDMVDYYTEAEKARKEMISALTYPTIVFIFTLAVVTFVLIYVVPKFVAIYDTMENSEIPAFTAAVIGFSNFLEKNILWIILIIVGVIILLVYLYRNVKIIRYGFQWLFMHIPILGNVIIYNEVTMFSKTFASLLSHNVPIIDSMNILKSVTNNETYIMLVDDTAANLARGEKISTAYKDQWAFPIPAYEMIVTGEKTGQLAEMMGKVSTYYQDLHKNMVTRIKALLEPILIIFLTFTVGLVLLAVIIPMFNMYQQVQSLG